MKRLLFIGLVLSFLVPTIASAQLQMCIPYWDFDDCDPENGEPPAWCGWVNGVNGMIGALNDLLAPLTTLAE